MAKHKTNNVIYPGDGTALIELTRGFHAIVDESDVALLVSTGCWRVSQKKNTNTVYAIARARNNCGNDFIVLMHRVILNAGVDFSVDHINGNGLDNRRANLRQCTSSENQWNSRIPKNNTSGFKGVYWNKANNKWRSMIKIKCKRIHVGYFSTVEEAAAAVAAARIKLHGEFANHGHGPDQHLVTSHSVPTTYSLTSQKNIHHQDELDIDGV